MSKWVTSASRFPQSFLLRKARTFLTQSAVAETGKSLRLKSCQFWLSICVVGSSLWFHLCVAHNKDLQYFILKNIAKWYWHIFGVRGTNKTIFSWSHTISKVFNVDKNIYCNQILKKVQTSFSCSLNGSLMGQLAGSFFFCNFSVTEPLKMLKNQSEVGFCEMSPFIGNGNWILSLFLYHICLTRDTLKIKNKNYRWKSVSCNI